MFRKIFISAISPIAFVLAVSAQPSNNNCVDAILINNLSGSCDSYSIEGANLDIEVSPCGILGPNESANVWFNFKSQGPEIEIDITMDSMIDYQVSIVKFNGQECDPNVSEVLACSDSESLQFNGLEEGEEYFLMITFKEGDGLEVNVCVDNPINLAGPPNDHPCGAIDLSPDGGCHNGTTIGATSQVSNPNCPVESQNSVWYQLTLTGNNNALELDLSNISLQGDVSVLIGQFLSGCSGNLTIVNNGAYCGPLDTTITVSGLSAVETYYVGIATSQAGKGDFSICVQQTGFPKDCSDNDVCNDAENLGFIPSSSEIVIELPVCVEGCNFNSNPEFAIANCVPANWGSVFYTFTTDGIAERISISINSDNMEAFSAALLGGCSDSTIIVCNSSNNGSLNLTNILVSPNTTFYLMIASSTENMGDFHLCISSFNLPEQCIPSGDKPTLEVTNTTFGSPPEGPFQSGEEVTFLYTLPSYQATATIQWLQALIPVFGSGWDPSSFDAEGRPVNSNLPNSASGATWSWLDQFEITYNGNSSFYSTFFNDVGQLALCYWTDPDCPNTGLNAGDGLPAGWYAYNQGTGPNCIANGNPNNGWGDGNTGPWTVEFTLTVRDLEGPDGCHETGLLDLSVRMFTMSDAQIGCWDGGTPNACAGDDFASAGEIINQCCQSPVIDLVDEQICSGEQTNIVLTSDQDPFVAYSWTVTAPPSVTGAENGSGSFIAQTLVNTSNQPQVVFYNVSGINESEFCLANSVSIPITVYPELVVDLGLDIDGCPQGEFQLGQNLSISGGSLGPFNYQWSENLGNNPNPAVSPNISTIYTLTVTDQSGCAGEDQIEVIVRPTILLEMSPDREFCEEDSPLAVVVNPSFGQAPFQLNWTTPAGNMTGQEIGATMTGTYQVEVTDANGCTGEMTVNIIMFETPIHDLFTVPNNIDSICRGEEIELVSITAQGLPPYSYTWIYPDGTQAFDQNTAVEVPGLYGFEVIDANGCVYLDSILLENREPPEISFDFGVDSLTVEFYAQIENADSFIWDFGNGNSSTDANPVFIFEEEGLFPVSLTAWNKCDTIVYERNVALGSFPQSGFEILGSTEGCAPFTVEFRNMSSANSEEWEWVFEGGNPETSTDENPMVTFEQAGIYSVTLKASNAIGTDTFSLQDIITVQAQPIAAFDYEMLDDGYYRFDNLSDYGDSYLWDFGDGNTSDEFSPIHEFIEAGTYWVELVAGNACGLDSFGLFVEFDPTSVLDLEAFGFRLFPNPSSGLFTLEFSEMPGDVRLRIYDIRGRIIQDKPWSESSSRQIIDLTGYSSGTYLLELLIEGNLYHFPVQLIKH